MILHYYFDTKVTGPIDIWLDMIFSFFFSFFLLFFHDYVMPHYKKASEAKIIIKRLSVKWFDVELNLFRKIFISLSLSAATVGSRRKSL